MIKNKIDFKLINLALLALIVFLLYQTGYLWMGILSKLWKILMPFFLAFIVAYALHPLLKYLQSKKIPKGIGVAIIVTIILGIMAFVILLIAPLLVEQLTSLFNNIITFLKEVSTDYDINFGPLQESLTKSFNDIILALGKYVSDGAINVINVSLGVITTFLISFSAAIYFLIDMDMLRQRFKGFLLRKSIKTFLYVKLLDREMKLYLTGFVKILFITLIEYTVVYYIIGHPNALLLGFLAVLGNLIPYFGGMIVNIIAAITAFVAVPFPSIFVKTVIAFFALSAVDGYVINPAVYGKTNKVHPIIVILSVFAGGILFGFIGVMLSLPLAIIALTTYKYYKTDITEKIEDIKTNKKNNKNKCED
jgi:predicted PurR-regulated permease PerM